ncbi:unnamed protein product [Didymodactylos carnosus]|uniref:NAD(P)(+)--arginine ADP-ribosyltransferase n=1 Tax=Didymodactylos carnosus TaxID=1234261 RepID=A0A815DBX4_9BILA|nr:unnamed protein product [Didymodactylos carnosus]CAF1295869.1 unnamed protein product [Didymodactylos carnosus]CAF3997926.1 unnamed protein product [Didymodactylos carnosus]CAF4110328.1 unnamed protein product [Didymodactylos carnosus]
MGQRISCVENSSASGTAVWEVVNDEVMTLANNYRYSLQQTWVKRGFLQIVKDILRLYIKLDLPRLMTRYQCEKIEKYFNESCENEEVKAIIKAYTATNGFSRYINMDLANLVSTNDWRDIRISPNAPEDRQYWEGALDVVCIIVHHPGRSTYEVKQETKVFRGMSISKNYLDNFQDGTCLTNKTFLSTSITQDVAERYLHTDEELTGCLCIYTIVPSDRRTALHIKDISKITDEEEVLILPYTTFKAKSPSWGCTSHNIKGRQLEPMCEDLGLQISQINGPTSKRSSNVNVHIRGLQTADGVVETDPVPEASIDIERELAEVTEKYLQEEAQVLQTTYKEALDTITRIHPKRAIDPSGTSNMSIK